MGVADAEGPLGPFSVRRKLVLKRTARREWDRFVCLDPLWFAGQGRLHGRATRNTVQPAPVVFR